jgi:hypothetical protein
VRSGYPVTLVTLGSWEIVLLRQSGRTQHLEQRPATKNHAPCQCIQYHHAADHDDGQGAKRHREVLVREDTVYDAVIGSLALYEPAVVY